MWPVPTPQGGKLCNVSRYTHMGFSLRGFSSHEGVRDAVFPTPLPIAGLIVALELAGAPAVVQRAVAAAAALLSELDVIIDHLVEIWRSKKKAEVKKLIVHVEAKP